MGIGSKNYGLEGRIVYAMKVAEILSFNEYWRDPRFGSKRPYLPGSLKQAYGDNIYHQDEKTGEWIQEDSHHSYKNGRPNPHNIEHDTQTTNVLIGSEFVYWGTLAPVIPTRFRNFKGNDVCAGRGHKCKFPSELVTSFIEWITSLGETGYVGDPPEF